MKNFLKYFLVMSLILNIIACKTYADKENSPDISSEAAILIDAKTGQVLYGKNIHKKMFPASTTKILTGILAIENSNLFEDVVVDDKTPFEIDGSHIALEPGEILSMNDLLHALLIASANDAAVVIAKHVSGSTEDFSKLMNKKAKELGAKNTHFVNPNGLPNEDHTTTAYDLAMIAKYAMKNKTFKDIVKNYSYVISPTNKKSESRHLNSSNKLLYSKRKINVDGKEVPIKYDGVNGVKTGYTVAAQQCLVASATKNGNQYISVVLRATGTDVYADTHKLLNYAFENFSNNKLASKNDFVSSIRVENGIKSTIKSVYEKDLYSTLSKVDINNLDKEIVLPSKITAPILKGQVLGKVLFKVDNKTVGSANIISTEKVEKGSLSFLSNLFSNIFSKTWFKVLLIFILLRVFIRLLKISRLKKRKRRRKQYSYYKKGV
ncbi:D-alanyl-D-alanine carboxypeptidase DacB [Gottschalkia purinilytica]|uniref:serine-type D-Ala-D-Ala carboxypeptidase n=1 Tax=Gottschalkia purinilytica TaxID=1503 RepID=A0A0L0WD73_GOTPU|nr:D-alanyl-D-alanine carboxypeptidase family protein [Gottschalkia purinilytica]KNF09429.1 D-alanyl-D-alanine carboxypeptidase DacB [Gottschalkia purinilytica]